MFPFGIWASDKTSFIAFRYEKKSMLQSQYLSTDSIQGPLWTFIKVYLISAFSVNIEKEKQTKIFKSDRETLIVESREINTKALIKVPLFMDLWLQGWKRRSCCKRNCWMSIKRKVTRTEKDFELMQVLKFEPQISWQHRLQGDRVNLSIVQNSSTQHSQVVTFFSFRVKNTISCFNISFLLLFSAFSHNSQYKNNKTRMHFNFNIEQFSSLEMCIDEPPKWREEEDWNICATCTLKFIQGPKRELKSRSHENMFRKRKKISFRVNLWEPWI